MADIGDLSEDEEETPKRKKQKKGAQADSDVDESDDEEMQGAGKNVIAVGSGESTLSSDSIENVAYYSSIGFAYDGRYSAMRRQ